jgi:NADH-quinone oxidoreductase subunit J
MNYYSILFYSFAALTVLSALVVVFARNMLYSAFALLFTFLGVAGLYILLRADFIAVAQIMVYVGGILILLMFGVMLTNKVTNVDIQSGSMQGVPATIIVGVFLGTLVLLMTRTTWISVSDYPPVKGTTLEIGERLITSYLLPFEVVGLLLLVVIMGAAMIARKTDIPKENA